eukprot:TRINITY_DN94630_c0_g1_i1.p1 TRINITY_DN94630_c0_g1~~TRINITY_DN94630_c0_g1_i1.p1  ORF type:complete len:424 (-),score=39.01 TRINITY_DN94630_c0_g1_i1:66-1337(-)
MARQSGSSEDLCDQLAIQKILDVFMSGDMDEVDEHFKAILPLWYDDIQSVNKDSMTPMLIACKLGHLPLVKFCCENLNRNPSTETSDTPEKMTALLTAADNGQTHIVEWLIKEKNCDPLQESTATHNSTAIMLAAFGGHLETMKWLTANTESDPKAPRPDERTPFTFAVQNGSMETVQWLVNEQGVDPKMIHSDGTTATQLAASNGYLEMAKWLVDECGCCPLQPDVEGFTPFLLAAQEGHLDVLQWLVKTCKVPTTDVSTDQHESTALLLAAYYGRLPVVRWLVEEGFASLDEMDAHGETPLSDASDQNRWHVVDWILLDAWKLKHQHDDSTLDFELTREEQIIVECHHNPLEKQGWTPHTPTLRWPVWDLGTHKNFPVVFQVLTQVAFWCTRQTGLLPELMRCVAQFWAANAFSPRILLFN